MSNNLKYCLFKLAQNGAAILILEGFARASGNSLWWMAAAAFTYYVWQTLNDRFAEHVL